MQQPYSISRLSIGHDDPSPALKPPSKPELYLLDKYLEKPGIKTKQAKPVTVQAPVAQHNMPQVSKSIQGLAKHITNNNE